MSRAPEAPRLGVLDWGIGGIATLLRLRAALPHADLVYWSDAGFTPYGKVAPEVLAARVAAVARRMRVAHLVIACNAASTVLDEARSLAPEAAFLGIIDPGIRLALASRAATIGIVGGARTIAAGRHAAALEAAGRRVTALVAQPLSAHVEAGRLDGPELAADLDPLCAALSSVDALLLACTHYPALAPALQARLPGVALLDPAAALVEDVVVNWGLALGSGAGRSSLFTTGSSGAMRTAARLAFGAELGPIAGCVA